MAGSWLVGWPSRSLNQPLTSQGGLLEKYATPTTSRSAFSEASDFIYGWPFQMDNAHLLQIDWISQGILNALLSLFNLITAVNYFLILSFGLVALASYAAWRFLDFSRAVSFIVALSLSLIPWHIQTIFFNSDLALYLAPPLFLLFVTFYLKWINNQTKKHLFFAVLALIVTSLLGSIWSFYSTIFVIIFLIYINLLRNSINYKNIIESFIFVLIIPISNLISLIYVKSSAQYPAIAATSGKNFESLERLSGSFSSLFLPSPLTGIPFISTLRRNFENLSLFSNQLSSPWSSLLVSAAISFSIALLMIFAFAKRNSNLKVKFEIENFTNLYLKIFLLLFTFGLFFYWTTGLGSLLGFLVSGFMQEWSQIFIYLAYFSVAITLLAIRQLEIFRNQNKNYRVGALIIVLVIIFIDQVINPYPADAKAERNYQEAINFSGSLAKSLDSGCPVLQIPVYPYPEAGYNLNDFADYDHFWLALADNSRPYSYGANKATQQFLWQNNLSQDDPGKLALQAAAVGYCAIVVDLSAYSSRVEEGNRWIKALGAPLTVSDTARWAAWPVAERYSNNQIRELISLNWFGTFAAGEVQDSIQIDFYERNFDLYALNPTQEKAIGEISFKAISGTCTPSQSVKIIDANTNELILSSEVNKEPKLLSFQIELEPREQKRISFELSSRICTVEWWSDTKVAFREQEFKLTQS